MTKKFWKNWFSNMIPLDTPYVEDGISYKTPEHYYQAMKTLSRDARILIATSPTGTGAKSLGQRVPKREDWDSIRISVMEKIQKYRFREGTQMYETLMNTKGPIVEYNNWCDNFFGDCICDECCNNKGLNILGKILMSIRDNTDLIGISLTQLVACRDCKNLIHSPPSSNKCAEGAQVSSYFDSYTGLYIPTKKYKYCYDKNRTGRCASFDKASLIVRFFRRNFSE